MGVYEAFPFLNKQLAAFSLTPNVHVIDAALTRLLPQGAQNFTLKIDPTFMFNESFQEGLDS